MTTLSGGGACGQVRFTATGAPNFALICQCCDCQRMTGSNHAAQMCHDASAFHIDGTLAHRRGHTVTKYVCPDCGAPLYGTTSRAMDIVMAMGRVRWTIPLPSAPGMFFAEGSIPWDHAHIKATP